MRLEGNSQNGGIGTRLLLYGPVAWENLGKIWEINGTGQDYSLPLKKVQSCTKFQEFSWTPSINSTTQDFSWLVPLILHI